MALLRALPAYAEITYLGSYDWRVSDRLFGGFSAIEVTTDGMGFVALTDRGSIARGTFTRDGDTITSIALGALRRLLGPTRAPLADDLSDSEGLAIGPDGTFYISFEGADGVRSFAGLDRPGSELVAARDFQAFQPNAGLEALAIGPDGALYTLPERSGLATRPFPVFRLKDGVWDQPFEITRAGHFLPVGADVGPDGRLYMLERDFTGIGFRSRIRRFDLDGRNEKTILETGLRTHDNLEGISVWQDAQGLRITLISDDNFRMFQRTEIVEYRLTE
ncbi:cobalamin/Fe3+-siderophores ABC transporter ATPase [Loktanella sp. 1ANDIMAR09]|nr:cobalamin/Fe3+-siderophores ABC transporter ATPase [Loktanella sp. 1ANDIMAR09]